MNGPVTERKQALALSEFIVAAVAIVALLAAQWMLSTAIHGANYYGWDGKMAQATIIAALKYAGLFHVTTISPIEGVGSQLLTMNVWVNPAYWPFAFFDREMATDVSALMALGVFMIACYVMARCFDVPVVPSAIAAQLCIVLFAPALLILLMPTNFCLTPGNAVVYAPHMIALGLLARIEQGSWHRFALLTAGIFALLLYGLYVDPLWSMVSGFSLAVAFGIVAISPLRLKTILLRMGALGCCVVLLVVSGAAGYVHALSQYTARVQYPALIDRPRSVGLVSALAYSPTLANMKYFYAACALGWLLGVLTLRGRTRVLAVAAMASFIVWVGYSTVYLLLLNAVWVPPIPVYLEHCLCALYIAGGVAGYWGVLQRGAWIGKLLGAAAKRVVTGAPRPTASLPALSPLFGLARSPRSRPLRAAALVIALVLVAIVPAMVADHAVNDSGPRAQIYYEPWPDEPELMQFFAQNVSSDVGQSLRGSIAFWTVNPDTSSTMANAWAHGMHTIDEYSQLVTPQAVYFLYAFLKQNEVMGSLNGFVPFTGPSAPNFVRAMQLFGTRYYLTSYGRAAWADQAGYPLMTLPRRTPGKEPGLWHIYEFLHPNVGNYSPTEIVTAQSAAEIIARMSAPDFDFAKQAVVSTPINETLVEAQNMQLSRIRGGFHVSGRSDGTSLVILPLQFSHCLRAGDSRVRFVRADFMMAGMIFSGDVDTDILFEYGIFSPACRRADLAETKQLDLKIDLRMSHLTGERVFPDWDGAVATLRAAGITLGLWSEETPQPSASTTSASPPAPEPPAPSGPAVTQETTLAELPKVATDGLALLGIQGLNAEVVDSDPILGGQPVLRLVAVPTEGRHYLAAQSTGLDKNRVYRITAWVKAPAGVKVELELRDGFDPHVKPENYGAAVFNPATRSVSSSSGGLKGRGIEQGPGEWQKIWVDLPTADGQFVLAIGVVSRDRSSFKGDGRAGLTFGGVEVAARS